MLYSLTAKYTHYIVRDIILNINCLITTYSSLRNTCIILTSGYSYITS